MRIKEVCSCGASIDVENINTSSVHNAIKEWREKHQHQFRSYGYGTVLGPAGYTGGAAVTNNANYVLNGEGEQVRI
jgi:hypothetical protein